MLASLGGPGAVRELQERAARALPAELVEDADGWWLRYAPSCAWWVGTVLPHGRSGPDEDEMVRRIERAEQFYSARGATAGFQITPQACPEGLDSILAERGYRRHSPVSLQAAAIGRVMEQVPVAVPVPAAGALRTRVDDHPTSSWFEVWHAVQGHGGNAGAEWDLLGRVPGPSAFAGAMIGDEVVAVGRAVADTGWAGVFGMATLPRARGKGAARHVLAALAGWAGEQGADHMYLQVEADNSSALRLYQATGFAEVCGYHYRVAG